ncbi:hypothetical protein CRE_30193 [Caenorhabditis remanei]|uniref:Uncharacterized protein n=1 Tax=Caenorhabditis remanei TaxID=31234 RepID=E3NGL5_CAERE|nr:hypothetical protein CRE_30193 [Caenorhabditis remanei]
MANVIGVLQELNNTLIAEVRNFTTEISNLKNTVAAAPTNNKKTFADMVRKSLPVPAAQVSVLRAAELAQTCDARKSCVIVRNADLASDTSKDNDFGAKVAKECRTAEPVSVFPRKLLMDHTDQG